MAFLLHPRSILKAEWSGWVNWVFFFSPSQFVNSGNWIRSWTLLPVEVRSINWVSFGCAQFFSSCNNAKFLLANKRPHSLFAQPDLPRGCTSFAWTTIAGCSQRWTRAAMPKSLGRWGGRSWSPWPAWSSSDHFKYDMQHKNRDIRKNMFLGTDDKNNFIS